MQKQLLNGAFIFMALNLLAVSAQAQNYCENGSYGNQLMWIESISSDPFVSDTGPFNNNYGDQDHLYIGYADYSNQTLDWQVGLNVLELVPGRFDHPALNSYPSYWQVWVDLNEDFIFSQDELLLSANGLEAVNTEIDLSGLQISDELLTRMRISISFGADAPACGSIGTGEVEDYSVRIVPAAFATLRVPEAFSTIQAAIDAAEPGDRVLVNDGEYDEDVVVNKALTIESVNGYEHTSVSSSANGVAFLVQAPFVTIKGFEVTTDFLDQYAGVYFFEGADDGQAIDIRCSTRPLGKNTYNVLINQADRVTVQGMMCDKFGFAGIWAEETTDSYFVDNTITNQLYYGIYLREALDVAIENNMFNENRRAGLAIELSNRVSVIGNQCSQNILQILPPPPVSLNNNHNGFGISAVDSGAMVISGNQCNNNSHAGFNLKRADAAVLTTNTADFNGTVGLQAVQATGLVAELNHFAGNMVGGLDLAYADLIAVINNVIESNAVTGMSLQTISNSRVEDNWVSGHSESVLALNSDNNQWVNNVFDAALLSTACHFTMDQSSNNQLYLNTFLDGNSTGICSLNTSSNQWYTSEVLEYQLQGQQQASQLGNYYSNADHTDVQGDGISDLPYILPGNEPADPFALSESVDNYLFQ